MDNWLVVQKITILKKYGVRQWLKDDIPYIKWKIKFMFETTNQYADHVDKASKIIQGKKCPFVSYKSSEDGCDHLSQVVKPGYDKFSSSSISIQLQVFSPKKTCLTPGNLT